MARVRGDEVTTNSMMIIRKVRLYGMVTNDYKRQEKKNDDEWEGKGRWYFALSGNVEENETKQCTTTTYVSKGLTGSVSDAVVIGHGPIQKIFAASPYHPFRFNWPL
ncbi:unnamed protein product [Cercopithifilaria johnstoni]|uniref:Uncharacterized protein n=1 Tax=Cercopithifilaria johnstoni TaxID=2874296 RepID=A0A8J2MDS0_9BILA|nr:unnamed protein product [Cercopithifilaria johnstoni]